MPIDLDAVVAAGLAAGGGLDIFIGACLTDGGVWIAERQSDGISYRRVLESSAERVSVAGRIHEIEQVVHTFWLELERDISADRVAWVLYFDAVATSARRARDAIVSHDRARDITWRLTLTGHAEVRDGRLELLSGLTQVAD